MSHQFTMVIYKIQNPLCLSAALSGTARQGDLLVEIILSFSILTVNLLKLGFRCKPGSGAYFSLGWLCHPCVSATCERSEPGARANVPTLDRRGRSKFASFLDFGTSRGAERVMCVNDLRPTRKSHALTVLK